MLTSLASALLTRGIRALARRSHRAIAATRRVAMSRLDDALGEGIERIVSAHHHRRLKRVGHAGVLAPDGSALWASGDPPPRQGNAFELMIDGADALPAMAAAIEGARERVHLAGWHAEPDFLLRRDGSMPVLRDLLAEAARRAEVRVLLWAGDRCTATTRSCSSTTAWPSWAGST